MSTNDQSGNLTASDQPFAVVALVTADDCNGSGSGFPGFAGPARREPARVRSGRVSPPDQRVPAPLLVAVSLVAVEALLLVLFGLAELRWLSATKVAMGVTTSLFFLVYGVGLGLCAWELRRLRSWARAPVVLAQLIQLGVAWSFRGGGTTAVSAALAVVAVLVLLGVFHPASIRSVADADAADRGAQTG